MTGLFSLGFLFVDIQAFVDEPMPSTHPQTCVDEMHIYQALTLDCYQLSPDQLDLNVLPMTMIVSTYLMQLSQSPMHDLVYQAMYAFNLFDETPPFAFTMNHFASEVVEDY